MVVFIKKQWLDEKDQLHRENDKAALLTYDNGKAATSEWYVHGEPKRENGPNKIDHRNYVNRLIESKNIPPFEQQTKGKLKKLIERIIDDI